MIGRPRRGRRTPPLWSTGTANADAAAVIRSLAAALGSGPDADGWVVERTRLAGRSTIFVVRAPREVRGRFRWLVKQPHTDWVQDDLAGPVEAMEEFDAVCRLHAHLGAVHDDVRVPEPVALLPDVGAFAMEYVEGVTVRQLLSYGSVRKPNKLLDGLANGARFLRHVHDLQPLPPRRVGLHDEASEVLRVADEVLTSTPMTLPAQVRRALERVPAVDVAMRQVLLHGDFGPGNILLADDGSTVGLDPALQSVGPPEDDLGRFVVLMSASIRFAPETVAAPLSRVRRRLESTLLGAYYDGSAPPAAYEIRLLHQLVRRWGRARELAATSKGGVLMPVRLRTVDAQFRLLMRDSAARLATAAT